jgi:extradiol dioxygenase family protein
MALSPFHLAIPVYDLEACRRFYEDVLGLERGRSSDHWTDYNLYGHQLVIHFKERELIASTESNEVDGKAVPVPHFGVVLPMEDWEKLAKKLKDNGVQFVIEPYVRFKGEIGEQATLFFLDPCGNALEFKSFKDMDSLFAY